MIEGVHLSISLVVKLMQVGMVYQEARLSTGVHWCSLVL